MGGLIYGLCALMAFLCASLLWHAYRQDKYRMLLWGCLCFVGLTLSNALLVVDKVMLPEVDLSIPRYLTTLVSMMILLYGLIWDME